jgi:hypothetical protein
MKKIALYLPIVIGLVIIIVYIVYRKRINSYVMSLVGGKINSEVPGEFAGQFEPQQIDQVKPTVLPAVVGASGGSSGSAPQYVPNYNTANLDVKLMKGSKGNEVLILQTELNEYLPQGTTAKLVADGKFGQKTQDALRLIMGDIYWATTLKDWRLFKKDKSLQTASGFYANFGT